MNLQPYTAPFCQTLYAALSDSTRNEEIQALLAKLDGLLKPKEERKETDQLQGKASFLNELSLDDLRVAALNELFYSSFLKECQLKSADSVVSRHFQKSCAEILQKTASKVLKTIALSLFYQETKSEKPFHRSLTWIALAPHTEVSKLSMEELEEFERQAPLPLRAKLEGNPAEINEGLKKLQLQLPWRLFQTFYIPVGRIPLLTSREIADYTPYFTPAACSLLTTNQIKECIQDRSWTFSFNEKQSPRILQIGQGVQATQERWKLFYEAGQFQQVVKKLIDIDAIDVLKTIPPAYCADFPLSYHSTNQYVVFHMESLQIQKLDVNELHLCKKNKLSIASRVLKYLSTEQIKQLNYRAFNELELDQIFLLSDYNRNEKESRRRVAALSTEAILMIVSQLRNKKSQDAYFADSDDEYLEPPCGKNLSTFLHHLSIEQFKQLDMSKLRIKELAASFLSISCPSIQGEASHPSEQMESIQKAIEALDQSKKEAYDRLEMLPLETLHQIFNQLPDSVKILYVERYLKRIEKEEVTGKVSSDDRKG